MGDCPLGHRDCPFNTRNGLDDHTPAEALMLLWTEHVDFVKPELSGLKERISKLEVWAQRAIGALALVGVLAGGGGLASMIMLIVAIVHAS